MIKILMIFIVLAMIVQIIKPLGVPGLKKRGDFWKLPLAGLVLLVLATALQF